MEYLAHSAGNNIPVQHYDVHIRNVYKMASCNAAKAGKYSKYGNLLKEAVSFASFYHDLGKVGSENQNVLNSNNMKSLPLNHVDAGVAALQAGSMSIVRNLASLFVYAHHRGLPSLAEEQARGSGNIFRDERIKEVVNESLNDYLKIHGELLNDFFDMKESPVVNYVSPLFIRVGLSCLVDADHTDTAHHYNKVIPEGGISLLPEKRLELLDNYVANLPKHGKRNKMRQQVYNSCRSASSSDIGIITCDSPVGTGKTTAVMAHLLSVSKIRDLRRIFVVLPFTNIIDQSVDIYRKALVLSNENSKKVVAAHHHRAEFTDIASRVFSFLWNAPITVTTAVQFFETLASNHPASLRKLHQIAGSAIFIDEAHAILPAHLWAQAWIWMRELVKDWGCYIVLASGSLNRIWELKEFSNPTFINIPELVADKVRKMNFKTENTRVNYLRKKESLNLDGICNWVRELEGPRLLILNTVHSAAAVAKRLHELYGDKEHVEHLSTALAPIHRETIYKRIKARLLNKHDADWTLVATSCVEAGVDFSFHTAAREFCSFTSMIQTAGRINRSGEYGESDVWNFRIIPEKSLKEHPTFRTSSHILEQMFEEGKITAEYCTEAMKREVREKNQVTADENKIVKSEKERSFPSVSEQFRIITANTVTAIIDKELCEKIERYEQVDFLELQEKTVSIFSDKINLFALRQLHGFNDLYLWTLGYDDTFLGYMSGVLALDNLESYFI